MALTIAVTRRPSPLPSPSLFAFAIGTTSSGPDLPSLERMEALRPSSGITVEDGEVVDWTADATLA